MKSKSKTLEEHATKRLAERFGVKLTQCLWDDILHQIHNKKATFYKKQSNRVTIWDVLVNIREQEVLDDKAEAGDLMVRIVYDKMRKCIISVLTLDMDCELDDCYLE